jgi:hypothetical protein
MAGNIPRWNRAYLHSWRKATDPLADNVVQQIIAKHDQARFHAVWMHLVTNRGIDKSVLPVVVRDYFEETAALPSFADHAMLKKGQEVFGVHGLACCMLLLCKSLPQTYACRKGAQVVYETGRLTEKDHLQRFTRRLMETSQFVVNVMTPGGLENEGDGMVTAQKVRLMHAAIRYYLHQQGWKTEKYDEPINQEDKAGTLMAFSALVLQGLELLHIELTLEEKEAYIHTWRVIGHLMGVHPQLIPEDYADAMALGQAIFDDQIGYSAEGEALTKACIDFLKDMVPLHLQEVPKAMIHYLIGDKASDSVGLNMHSNWLDKLTAALVGHVFRHSDLKHPHHKRMAMLSSHLQRHIMQSMIKTFNHHKQIMFYIPPSLKQDWNI